MTLRARVLALAERRQWATDVFTRSANLFLEVAELTEAVREKRGDTLEESADALFTLLALSPHELTDIVKALEQKIDRLWDAPRYKGEGTKP